MKFSHVLGIVCLLLVIICIVVIISAGIRVFKNRKCMTYDILKACHKKALFAGSLLIVLGIAISYLSGDFRELFGALIRAFPALVIYIIVTRLWLKKLKKDEKDSE